METISKENSAQVKQSFRVVTQSLDSQRMEYTLPRGTTIEQFKQMISRNSSIPLDKIRLVFRAKALLDAQKIEEIISEDDQVFHLIARLNVPEAPAPLAQNTSVPQTNPQAPPNIQIPGMPFDLQSIFGNLNPMFGNNTSQGSNPVNNGNPSQPQNPLEMFGSVLIGGAPMQIGRTTWHNVTPQNPNSSQNEGQGSQPANNPDIMNILNNVSSLFGNVLGATNLPPQNQTNSSQTTPNQQGSNITPPQPQTQPQQQAPLQHNVEFHNARRSQNDVISVNNQGINISLSTSNQPVQRLLDTQSLRINDSLINTNNSIDIDIPRRQETNNSATMTGNYLRTLHDQLYKFLPQLLRCSDILQAEQRLRDGENRAHATRFVRNFGRSVGQFQKAFTNLNFLTHFDFKDQPSNFILDIEGDEANNANNQIHPPPLQTESQTSNVSHQPVRIHTNTSELSEEEIIQRDRQNLQNLMNTLSRGVPVNSTVREINQISGQETDETDIINIIFESLSMTDVLAILSGRLEPLNTNHHKIRAVFQDLLIKNQNNDKKMIKDLFGSLTSDLAKAIKKGGPDVVFEGFDIDLIMNDVNEEYYSLFKEVFLDEYSPEAQNEQFSEKYSHTLRLYYGKLAYEVSEGMENGIDDFHRFFKNSLVDYCTKIIGPGFDFSNIFDSLIWRHIEQGYTIHKQQSEHLQAERRLLGKLKEARRLDEEEQPGKELSEAYKKGNIF
jgi:hypothetical protein